MSTEKCQYKVTYKTLRLNGFTKKETMDLLNRKGLTIDILLEIKRKELGELSTKHTNLA